MFFYRIYPIKYQMWLRPKIYQVKLLSQPLYAKSFFHKSNPTARKHTNNKRQMDNCFRYSLYMSNQRKHLWPGEAYIPLEQWTCRALGQNETNNLDYQNRKLYQVLVVIVCMKWHPYSSLNLSVCSPNSI